MPVRCAMNRDRDDVAHLAYAAAPNWWHDILEHAGQHLLANVAVGLLAEAFETVGCLNGRDATRVAVDPETGFVLGAACWYPIEEFASRRYVMEDVFRDVLGKRAARRVIRHIDAAWDVPDTSQWGEAAEDLVFLDSLAVVEQRRRQGIGRALVDDARAHGPCVLYCSAVETSRPRAFYERLGFTSLQDLRDYSVMWAPMMRAAAAA